LSNDYFSSKNGRVDVVKSQNFVLEKTMAKVLVIDDSLTDLQVTSGSLQKAGFTVMTAQDEQDARAQIARQKPDLIVLDVVLPERSGFEICRDLKDEPNTKEIPVVLCSSKGSSMDKYWGMQQGADAYLAKPVDADELVQTVKKFT
jgi:two-component system, chemotaxis family, response regulator PixH